MHKPTNVDLWPLTRQMLASLADGATVLCRQTGRALTVSGRDEVRQHRETVPVLRLRFKGAPYAVTPLNMGKYGVPKAPLATMDGLPSDD